MPVLFFPWDPFIFSPSLTKPVLLFSSPGHLVLPPQPLWPVQPSAQPVQYSAMSYPPQLLSVSPNQQYTVVPLSLFFSSHFTLFLLASFSHFCILVFTSLCILFKLIVSCISEDYADLFQGFMLYCWVVDIHHFLFFPPLIRQPQILFNYIYMAMESDLYISFFGGGLYDEFLWPRFEYNVII